MSARENRRCVVCLSLILGLGAGSISDAFAQDVLHIYGSEGPFPAINEAARAFEREHNAATEVVAGPTSKWREKAARDADVIFASAEFMMAGFLNTPELDIVADSVTPLYVRRGAILVRPGNPKRILDFPDLLRPGVGVMVVTGSGQTGLWEDMAGKQGDAETIRALRKNIVCFAPNSDEAVRIWGAGQDIDAWLTWDIWHTPLRDRAELVPVSEDYAIYRQCSIALTRRGTANPLAGQFVKYLTLPAGAAVFASWGWITPATDATALKIGGEIRVVCEIKHDDWSQGVGTGLACIQKLVRDYEGMGIQRGALCIRVVCCGDASYWVLKDERYQSFTKREGHNPNKDIIGELAASGVSVEVCGQEVQEHGWRKQDILPEVTIVPSALARIIDLQLQGYAYVGF